MDERERLPEDRVVIVPYDPAWPALFRRDAARLRQALGPTALRIDHIGSTAVPDLAAKPVIDIQISVLSFDPLNAYRRPLEALGFVFRADNPDRTKRYFREAPGNRRTHIHVRVHGSWSEQFALLVRDFLRAHPDVAERYAVVKRALARQHAADRHAYTDAKGPFIWQMIHAASDWSQRTGWAPGPSDA